MQQLVIRTLSAAALVSIVAGGALFSVGHSDNNSERDGFRVRLATPVEDSPDVKLQAVAVGGGQEEIMWETHLLGREPISLLTSPDGRYVIAVGHDTNPLSVFHGEDGMFIGSIGLQTLLSLEDFRFVPRNHKGYQWHVDAQFYFDDQSEYLIVDLAWSRRVVIKLDSARRVESLSEWERLHGIEGAFFSIRDRPDWVLDDQRWDNLMND